MRSFSSSRPIGTKLTATALLLLTAIPASAGVIADRPTWLTQATSVTNYDFDTLEAGTEQIYNTSAGLILPAIGVSLVGYSFSTFYNMAVSQGATPSPWLEYDWSSGAIARSEALTGSFTGGQTPIIRVTFTGGPVTAFAVDLGTGGVSTGNINVTPQGQATTTLTTQVRPTFTFYGITSNTPFSYVDIAPTTANSMAIIDNIAYGTYNSTPPPDPTPELASILAVATGLIFLAKLKSKSVQQTA